MTKTRICNISFRLINWWNTTGRCSPYAFHVILLEHIRTCKSHQISTYTCQQWPCSLSKPHHVLGWLLANAMNVFKVCNSYTVCLAGWLVMWAHYPEHIVLSCCIQHMVSSNITKVSSFRKRARVWTCI